MTTFIWGYKPGSRSVNALSTVLNLRKIKHNGSAFTPNQRRSQARKVVVNWGASSISNNNVLAANIINPPDIVGAVSNKLSFFRMMNEAGLHWFVPNWTTDVAETVEWRRTVARSVLQGHSGRGITITERGETPVQAPLYTKYIPKDSEYRIHLKRSYGTGVVFDQQRKGRREDVPDDQVNWGVRNNANGFVYVRNEDTPIPAQVLEAAEICFNATGLDFGAVDVIYNSNRGRAYVLEINTAPGLEGTTLTNYTSMLTEVINNKNNIT